MNSAIREPDTFPSITNCGNSKVRKSLIDEAYPLRAQVHDIEIACKLFGTGEPVILIMGFGGSMNNWDVDLIRAFYSYHNHYF